MIEPAKAENKGLTRRRLLKKIGIAGFSGVAVASGTTLAEHVTEDGVEEFSDSLASLFQTHYRRMSPEEVEATIARLQRKTKRKYGKNISIDTTHPLPNVLFGYALNISKCKGYRKCVDACVEENNQGRDTQIQYIRVLEMERGSMNLEESNHYYDPETVPQKGKFYMPVQCMQCENPPCVRACPVKATWKETDGVVVIDYDWCIGCRYCMTACPYWARHFNWNEPELPPEELNPVTHYLGNRPRSKGVMEKCMFCVQRTRKGQQPACMEACPTGARIFGNLLDPESEIRYILENKTVFRLKEDLGTEPKFWYFTD
ncbi:MAG: 4Fe-4S ferredoxin [Deltaproteobacteria bacterium]|jgi:molybdopterin-containing oxidoreductase family iron-sulfur binding subunit|nr:4Fe-4S ferredoxin [Deltaproteobacteria bacterium]MDP6309093.1 4Fe-4S dicluster domain-containing protein [SAR324 cluster bacterium]MDP7170272.1 4Fe-4S dicluster domain-containing protein [SAR324 cluster bacterium]HBR59782.1 4Fe-4S ferredoxin [Deltaproteobacteria bacterium]HCV45774.1 4Fe-4S ferredoxin [Deltaproteobacteria bacterium]|tara:strand:+ start:1059 stop:2006 length:948 start_codon:yes stop_codon:yes gene_type:complete